MKVTVVPAQVTTVEDRIAGSLGLSQLLLLAGPVFAGSALYIILPPTMHSATYKLVVITILMFFGGLLAIRIKGKILLLWLVVILRYNIRPRYYLFNKNSLAARDQPESRKSAPVETEKEETAPSYHRETASLTTAEVAHMQAILTNPAANLTFKTNKKGGLYALITEVKE